MRTQRDHTQRHPRALVVSCGTGGGHNVCADAIRENLISHDVDCDFLELYDLVNHRTSNRVASAYVNSVRQPQVFGNIYRLGNFYSEHHLHRSPVYLANRSCGHLLADYLWSGRYDLAVTTHLFAAEALTIVRNECGLIVPSMGVSTDYTAIPFWEDTDLDLYAVPHRDVAADFLARGIPEERILPIGIPVPSRFTPTPDRAAMREDICARHGLDPRLPLIMVMSGSMGFGNLHELVAHLVIRGRAASGCNVIVSCGANSRVAYELGDVYRQDPHTIIGGYLPDDELYIGGCDVLVTKPGGLTSTQACVMQTPLVLCSPIPGCETINRRFLVDRGCAASGDTYTSQTNSVFLLLENERMRKSMMAAQASIINPNAAEDVCAAATRLMVPPTMRTASGLGGLGKTG